jgi:effector-binding domain-containing protein
LGGKERGRLRDWGGACFSKPVVVGFKGTQAMLSLPKILPQTALSYMAITETIAMGDLDQKVSMLLAEVYAWLAARGVAVAGPALLRHNVISPACDLEIEFGVVVAGRVQGDGRVMPGEMPAGSYGVVRFFGNYDQLFDVNAVLVGWAKERGVAWDVQSGPEGDRFAARVEYYHSDPAANPDPATWVSEVMIKTAS